METESSDSLFRKFFGRHYVVQGSFVKVISKCMLRQSMHLPNDKYDIFKRFMFRKVTLQVPGGEEWRVGVSENNRHKTLFFCRGWLSFVDDNKLELGNLVHFFYVGGSRFCVVICPGDGTYVGRKSSGRKVKRKSTGREKKVKRTQRKRQREPEPEPESSLESVNETGDAVDHGKPASDTGFQPDKTRKQYPLFLRRNFKRQPLQVRSRSTQLEHALNDRSDSVRVCRTGANSFIVPLKRTDYDVVDVESTLAQEFLPQSPKRMFLMDSGGTRWPVKWFGWKRCAVSCGWVDFVAHHGLESGDLCLFQLKDSNTFTVSVYKLRQVGMRRLRK